MKNDRCFLIVGVLVSCVILLFVTGCQSETAQPHAVTTSTTDSTNQDFTSNTKSLKQIDDTIELIEEETATSQEIIEQAQTKPDVEIVELPPSEAPKDDVVVTVAGKPIMQSQVDKKTNARLKRLGRTAQGISDAMHEKMVNQVIDMMIVEQLIRQKCVEKNIQVTSEDVQKRMKQLAMKQRKTIDEFIKAQQGLGLSPDDLKEQIIIGLKFEKLIDTEFPVDFETVTEEDAMKYYTDKIIQYTVPEKVRASHILISTRGLDETGKAEANDKVESLLQQIQNDANFAQLAGQHSGCPSKSKGGDLGFFEKRQMVPEFSEVAFKLQKDQVSGIVETKYGYHIIKVTDRQEESVKRFEDVKDNIIKKLMLPKKRTFTHEYIEQLKSQADIVWTKNKSS